ncbi:pterin 4 alpha carbinolamine dehydratase-domain-containing protein [Cercophora newfieldiana]|uniref:4a-hydroxytetrahydrobiopterin dehydratase n=1 Tax=Cercophora newfieldiana TaxID=92897 RepID=A0AA40CN68_9PEZI|nr:pterin 4 alpha carbinolamine dehydratase-domain-containing protein [Cercophora newfieldiana]
MSGRALIPSQLFTARTLPGISRQSPHFNRCVAPPLRQKYVRRTHTHTHTHTQSMPQPKFSAGTVPADAETALAPLLTSGGGRWSLTADGEGLERTFKFTGFAKAWVYFDFMTAVSIQCKIKKHHPEWSNVFNTTYIRWTTHNPKGLSTQDIEMAIACDAIARDLGEIAQQPDQGPSCELAGLANTVVGSAGDCCTPKK